MKPFFSVIIPSFNHAKFIGKAIKSVLSQTFTDFEIIIIDNNSNDDTDKIISQLPDNRIRVLKIFNDGIIARSRNMGIKESKGKWISFLDSDDYWHENKLLTVFNLCKTMNQIDVICHDEFYLYKSKNSLNIYGPVTINIYKQLLYTGNCFSTSATSIKSKFLKEKGLLFRENIDFVTVEDYDYWMLLANAGAKFKIIHEPLGTYLIHDTNSSLHLDRTIRNASSVLKNHVYQQQKITKNKDRLWKSIANRLNFEKNILLQNLSLYKILQFHYIFFSKDPIFYFKYMSYKFQSKFYFNKLKFFYKN